MTQMFKANLHIRASWWNFVEVNFSGNANHVSKFVKPSDCHRSRGPEALAGDLLVPSPTAAPRVRCGPSPVEWDHPLTAVLTRLMYEETQRLPRPAELVLSSGAAPE